MWIMFEVEIKTKRFDENGTYYVVIPVGELSDKLEFCDTFVDKTDEEVLIIAKEILNNLPG